jgi:MFS family permease
MVGLGIVLLVSERTGSYALAGLLSAAFQVSAAGGAILSSRFIDRWGQARLLVPLALGHAVGLALLIVAVEEEAALGLAVLAAVAAGVCQPAVGAMVRARWARATPDEAGLRTAFAWESVLDELIFTVGPMLTALLAFGVGLPVPLVVGAVLCLGGSVALSLQRRTQPPPQPSRAHGQRRGWARGLPLVVVASLGVGGVFGAYEVAVVAFTRDAGAPGMSGVVLGCYALGSLVGGLVFGGRHWRSGLGTQLAVLSAALVVVLLPAPLVGDVRVLVATSLVAGLAVAPVLIVVFSLTERLVAPDRLTEGLTWTNSGLAVGFSVGTALGGVLIDAGGSRWGFLLAVGSAGTALVVALIGRARIGRLVDGRDEPAPVVSPVTEPIPGPGPFA